MKKSISVLFLALSLGIYNNGVAQTAPNNSSKNILVADAIGNAFLSGNVNGLENLIAADAVVYTSTGMIKGIENIKAYFIRSHASSAGDTKLQHLKTFADNDVCNLIILFW